MNDTTFIYGLFDPRDCRLRYIGKSDNPQKRLKDHIKSSKQKNNLRVYNWIRSLLSEGLEPSIEILEECTSDNWQESEKAWIAECKKFGLDITNLTEGGDYPPSQIGKKISEEHKEILRQVNKVRLRTPEERQKLSASKKGKSTWVKGRHLSEEHKRKIGLANSGKKPSEGTIAKRLETIRGRKSTEEQKKKISSGLKLAYSEGRRTSRKGKIHSAETRQKISEANKGRIVSEETKKKISEANKKSLREYYKRKRENEV